MIIKIQAFIKKCKLILFIKVQISGIHSISVITLCFITLAFTLTVPVKLVDIIQILFIDIMKINYVKIWYLYLSSHGGSFIYLFTKLNGLLYKYIYIE